jgi:hypothetical protein
MKMLWYADALHHKRYDRTISGMVYKALPMGAVPIAHNQILSLNGIDFDEMLYGDNTAYRFKVSPGFSLAALAESEVEVLDAVICVLGHLCTEDIVARMHKEEAYQATASLALVSFAFANQLSID